MKVLGIPVYLIYAAMLAGTAAAFVVFSQTDDTPRLPDPHVDSVNYFYIHLPERELSRFEELLSRTSFINGWGMAPADLIGLYDDDEHWGRDYWIDLPERELPELGKIVSDPYGYFAAVVSTEEYRTQTWANEEGVVSRQMIGVVDTTEPYTRATIDIDIDYNVTRTVSLIIGIILAVLTFFATIFILIECPPWQRNR